MSAPPVTALEATPADLAKESKKESKVQKNLVSFPLRLMLPFSVLAIITIIVAPTSNLFISNAYNTVDYTAFALLTASSSKSVSDINNLINNFLGVNEAFGNNLMTRDKMVNNVNHLEDEVWDGTWTKAASEFLYLHDEITTLSCISNEPVGGRKSPDGRPNVTMVGFNRFVNAAPGQAPTYLGNLNLDKRNQTAKIYNYNWMDFSTELSYWAYFYDSLTGQPFFPRVGAPAPIPWVFPPHMINVSYFSNYLSLAENPTSRQTYGRWYLNYLATYTEPTGVSDIIYWAWTSNFYQNTTVQVRPLYACQTASATDLVVSNFLADNRISPNAVIAFFTGPNSRFENINSNGTEDGALLATSIADAVIDRVSRVPFTIYNNPNPKISRVGQSIRKRYPNITAIDPIVKYKDVLSDGSTWYISLVRFTPDPSNTWYLMTAIPRTDYFTAIDTSISTSIILILVLSIVMVSFIAVLSVMFVLPLLALVKEMAECTNMNFAAIENGSLTKRSVISEVANLQDSFMVMVKAFAGGLRKNADLMARKQTKVTSSLGEASMTSTAPLKGAAQIGSSISGTATLHEK